jgi:hypothetical protein
MSCNLTAIASACSGRTLEDDELCGKQVTLPEMSHSKSLEESQLQVRASMKMFSHADDQRGNRCPVPHQLLVRYQQPVGQEASREVAQRPPVQRNPGEVLPQTPVQNGMLDGQAREKRARERECDVPERVQRMCIEQPLSSACVSRGPELADAAASATSSAVSLPRPAHLPLVSVVETLIQAMYINTNLGSDTYKQTIETAKVVAATCPQDSDLANRIHTAAFRPHHKTGRWQSNTPSLHRETLGVLLSELGMLAIVEFLYALREIASSCGTSCCHSLMRRAVDFVKNNESVCALDPGTVVQIEALALDAVSASVETLIVLIRSIELPMIISFLEKAWDIDTNRGSLHYKDLVQRASDLAAWSTFDTTLAGRILEAAFKPHPVKGVWMSNSRGHHRSALAAVIRALKEQHQELSQASVKSESASDMQ